MKNALFALLVSGIWFTSCNKEVQPLSEEEIRKEVDSLAAVRIKELDRRAEKDLGYRMKIELKARVDSILAAKEKQKMKDTVTILRDQKK